MTSAQCNKFRDKTSQTPRLKLKATFVCFVIWRVICIKEEVTRLANQIASFPVLKERQTENAKQIFPSPFHCENYLRTVRKQVA